MEGTGQLHAPTILPFGEEKSLLHLLGIEPRTVEPTV